MNREDMIRAIAQDDADQLATWAIGGPFDEIVRYVRLYVVEKLTDEELAVEYAERWPTFCIVCDQQIDPDGRQKECIICGNGPICGLCWISGSRCLKCEDIGGEPC